jgi:hypothetical protein
VGIIFEICIDKQVTAAQTQAFKYFLQALDSLRVSPDLRFAKNFISLLGCQFYNLLIILRFCGFNFGEGKLFVNKHDIL